MRSLTQRDTQNLSVTISKTVGDDECTVQDPAERRHLLRIWVAPPNGWPLPDAFAERYGSTTIGERGGIVIPGYSPRISLTAE